jgi:hypothetical protein
MKTVKTTAERHPSFDDLDPVAIPVSVRLPTKTAFLLYLYSEQMSTSAGKLLSSLLEDVLPAFESGNFEVKLRIPQVYKAMENADLLRSVDPEELKERMLQRYEGTGPRGRPKKVNKKPG